MKAGPITILITVVCSLILGVPPSPAQPTGHRMEWDDPGLALFLTDVTDLTGLAEFRFELRLKPGVDRADTRIGYPRYREEASRWQEAVVRAVVGPKRTVTMPRPRHAPYFFSVVVPYTTTNVEVSVGNQTIRFDPGEWFTGISSEHVDPGPARSPGRPANLEAELRWSGEKPFVDGALDAEEKGELLIDIANTGDRTARNVAVRISPDSIEGLSYPATVTVPDISAGRSATVRLPFQADSTVADGDLTLSIQVIEPFGHDARPIELQLVTRSVDPPVLVFTEDFSVEGVGLPVPRDRIVTVHLRVRNAGHGVARRVEATVIPGDGVFTAHDSENSFDLGDIEPGQTRSFPFRCYANRRAEELSLQVALRQGRDRDAVETSRLTLPLEDSAAVPRIVRIDPDPRAERQPLAPAPPPLTSDVDRHVPSTGLFRPGAIAVVLGVEEYAAAPPARYAASDARTAARYFEHALGVPAERVELLVDEDVTLARMNRLFERDGWLARRVEEETEVFVFFAGHGIAESEAFDPYLMPHDGDLNYTRQTGLSLDRLVERLASLDAAHVTLFIDACFSGLTREGGPLVADTRRLVVVPVQRGLSGVSVLSAARGGETAHSLDEQGHGLFSYYLFKGLGGAADINRDNSITAGELAFFLEDEVTRAAALADHEQTPSSFVDDLDRELVRLP